MADKNKFNVAIIGLGFGAEFIPIYQRHPLANMYAICQRTENKLKEVGDAFGIAKRYTPLRGCARRSATSISSTSTRRSPIMRRRPSPRSRPASTSCRTVPMATTIEECQQIVELVKKTGLKYMMAETVVYAREFLFVKEMYDKGELGKMQFLQASHQQDMDGWPNYWPGLPPMHYATHCVGPCLALTRAEAEYVSCFGSGTIREELIGKYNSPFAVETAPHQVSQFRLDGPHLSLAVRHGPAVPRELRCLRHEEDRSSGR